MPEQFGAFQASELYCPKCGKCQPVREKLLLILPNGELNDYVCVQCHSSLGQREVTQPAAIVSPNALPPRPIRRLLR